MIRCEAEGCGKPFDPIANRWLSPCCHLKHNCCEGGPAPVRQPGESSDAGQPEPKPAPKVFYADTHDLEYTPTPVGLTGWADRWRCRRCTAPLNVTEVLGGTRVEAWGRAVDEPCKGRPPEPAPWQRKSLPHLWP